MRMGLPELNWWLKRDATSMMEWFGVKSGAWVTLLDSDSLPSFHYYNLCNLKT